MLHVILRWCRLLAFQTCTGTFQALSQCASTNIKALQLIAALSGETSGLAAKAVQRNAVCSAWRETELQFEHPWHLISLCGVQGGFVGFRIGFCSALTRDRAACDSHVFQLLKRECSQHLEHCCMLWLLSIPVQLLISLLFLPQTVVIPRSKVCNFFSFAQLCFMTLFPMTGFLNRKPLAHGIVSLHFFVSSQVFWGCESFCAGSPFPAYVIVGPSEKCHE